MRANHVKIVETLERNSDAAKTLCRHFIQEGWIQPGVTKTPDELMSVALDRISNGTGDYHIFMSMLRLITGLDQIRECIETTTCKFIIIISMSNTNVTLLP